MGVSWRFKRVQDDPETCIRAFQYFAPVSTALRVKYCLEAEDLLWPFIPFILVLKQGIVFKSHKDKKFSIKFMLKRTYADKFAIGTAICAVPGGPSSKL